MSSHPYERRSGLQPFIRARNGASRLGGRDGCGCPPWVLRCAHWDQSVLVIVSDSLFVTRRCDHGHMREGKEYGVGMLAPTRSGSCWKITGGTDYDDLPSAEAEFFRREAEMLQVFA